MWLTILLCHMAFNSLTGPWNGTAFWGQLQEWVSHCLSDASPTDPLLQFFLPSVAEERGEMELLADPGYAAHVLETLRAEGGFLQKGPRVRLCTFSSWLGVCQDWDKVWGSRALLTVYVGLKLGYFSMGDAGKLQVCRPRLPELSKGAEADPTKGCKQIDAMRSRAHNTLHAATLVVLGDSERRRARIICCLSKPCQAWQGCQVTANRCPIERGDYFLCAASGSFMPALQSIFKVMSSPWQLEHMGFTLGRVRDMPPDAHRAFVASEQEWASLIVELASQLVMHRMRLLSHWAGGYGTFALPPGRRILSGEAPATDGEHL